MLLTGRKILNILKDKSITDIYPEVKDVYRIIKSQNGSRCKACNIPNEAKLRFVVILKSNDKLKNAIKMSLGTKNLQIYYKPPNENRKTIATI